MIILNRVQELENYLNIVRNEGKNIGFVPTMGALHAGHIALIHKSREQNDITVCSVFVNPTQFNDPNDLNKYPRTLEADSRMLEKAGCDILFAPAVSDIYTQQELELKLKKIEDKSWTEGKDINFGQLDKVMEGKHRPGHFNGVVQVVSKLFRIVKPERAYFGQKDFQQLAIIRSMTKQLGLDVEIIPCPIVREKDGLAMSSRNTRLSDEERKAAPLIYKILLKVKELSGHKTISELNEFVKEKIGSEPLMKLEYFEIADPETLQPIADLSKAKSAVACIALKLGDIRLIDNIVLK
jgi:pantoate--beta-alanine ligase